MQLIDEVIGYAKDNAGAANPVDRETWAAHHRNCVKIKSEIERLRAALEFYADPIAWKKQHDPDDDVRIPDFYSETSFADTAIAALAR